MTDLELVRGEIQRVFARRTGISFTGISMNSANYLGLLAAAVSAAVFLWTWTKLQRSPRPKRWLAVGVLGLLSLPATLAGVYYLHLLPEWAWFYDFRAWPGSEWAGLLAGAAGGAIASLLPRWCLGLPLFATLSVVTIPYLKPLLDGLPAAELTERWAGEACLQSTASTCGPACVSTILRRLGAGVSEREVAHAAHTSRGGTEAWYLARYVRSRGYRARFVIGSDWSPAAGTPAVVGVRLPGESGHFISILSADESTVVFADPLWGLRTMPRAQFKGRYTFTGFHLVISRP